MRFETAILASILAMSSLPAFAQGYDMSTLVNYDTGQQAANTGQAYSSLGARGDNYRSTFRSGQAGRDQNSGHLTGVTSTQRGGIIQNRGYSHLSLPYVSSGGLAPVFGMGQQVMQPAAFTTPLEDNYTTTFNGGSISVNAATGQTFTRIVNFRTATTPGSISTNIGGVNLGIGADGAVINGGNLLNGTTGGYATSGF